MSPLSILVVEDNVLIGLLLAEMLAGLGHETAEIQTTEEGAVAAVVRSRPDLMIVDVRLAHGSGVSAVERITQAGPIPIVFMSGLGPLTVPSGAVVLKKPFFEADLIRAIARALEQASSPA
jgi:CheY-like chemotaxis protein